MERVLELFFVTADGKTAKLSIENPVTPVDQKAVELAMDRIVAAGVFANAAGVYAKKKEAKLVETNKTEYVFA